MLSESSATVVDIRGLGKSYGKLSVLRGLALSVQKGHVYGFLGRNGAGKSTTIRILMGITKADQGSVSLFGSPVQGDAIALRRRVGYVAQEQSFYGWMTARRLGRFVGRFYPSWDDAGFVEHCARMEVPLERKVGTFSGGMKVKLGLALALAHRPELLILDEPTAGLDPVARHEFLEQVRDDAERTGRTTFFSTHLIDEIELAAHRVGIVDEGRMRFEGSVSELGDRVRAIELPADVQDMGDEELAREAIEALGVRVLSDRERDGIRRLVFEALEPEAFERVSGHFGRALQELPLERAFIELVRRDRR